MHWQGFAVVIAVWAAGVYTVWTLMPGVLRKALLQRLRHPRVPPVLRQWAAIANTTKGCAGACNGCSQDAAGTEKPLVFQPRRRS